MLKEICKNEGLNYEETLKIVKLYYSLISREITMLNNSSIFIEEIGLVKADIRRSKKFLERETISEDEKEKVNRIYAKLYKEMGERLKKLYGETNKSN